jgi:PAS domain S-box-containing protein
MLIPQRFRAGYVEHRKGYFTQPRAILMGSGLDLYAVRKDGTEFPVEVSLSPLETNEGTLVSAAIRDITARKRIEEALRESEERFRVALKNSPIVVFNQDLDLRYTWINSPILEWARQDYLGRTDAEIVGGEEGARLMAIKQGVVQSGVGVRTEVTVNDLGEPHCFDLTVEPLRDAHGTIIGVTCASVDVTGRERLIEELRQALQGEATERAAANLRIVQTNTR